MKKFARKTTFRSLASACFVGTSCCGSLLFGQQLMPVQKSSGEALPPIVQSQAINPVMPPIVQASSAAADSTAQQAMPPIVQASSVNQQAIQPKNMPPIVSVDEMMANEGAPVVQASNTPVPAGPDATAGTPDMPTLQRGKNFPTDGERRIAEFIQANRSLENDVQPKIASTGYGLLQQNSPSDVIVNPVPVPNIMPSPMVEPMPMQLAPSIGGQAMINGQGNSVLQNQARLAPGSANYFESAGAYDNGVTADVVVDYGSQSNTFDCCGFICSSRYYSIFDAVYFRRNDGVFRASNISTISDYDSSWGGRVTLGKKRDCTRGYEATFMAFDPWIATSTQFNPPGTLVGALRGNLAPDAYSAFNDGTYAQQWNKTRLLSLEVNRTWWGSDVAKAFWGARYIHFQDDFRLSMANIFGEQGFHSIQGRNQMFGVHAGMEVLYDIGYRLSFSYGCKLGGYANVARNTVTHINNGALRGFGGIEDTQLSWSAEFGIWSRYKLSANVRFRAGYELFSLFSIYDAESMYSPAFGTVMPRIRSRGDAVFHGPSIGFEVYR